MQIVLDKIAKNGKKDNELILKSEHKFKSKKNNAFNEEFNQIALSANDDKEIQSIDSIETYAYGTSKDLVCKRNKSNVTI